MSLSRPKPKRKHRLFPEKIKPFVNEKDDLKVLAWNVEEKPDCGFGSFLRNMLSKVFTRSLEETSSEYEDDCERRKAQIEEIVLKKTCNVKWVFGLFGDINLKFSLSTNFCQDCLGPCLGC